MLARSTHLYFVLTLSLLIFCCAGFGQKPAATSKPIDPNLTRWKIALDALEQQSRSIGPDLRRPYFISDIANAYFEVDRTESIAQLNSALDIAWTVVRQDKKQRPVLNYVLGTAAKLDPTLLKPLNERLAKKEGAEKEASNIPGQSFYEILDQNPERAAQMLEAYAPQGIENGRAISLMIQLANKDIALANRVYNTYLRKIVADESLGLEMVLPLAGWAFGYSESWTMDRRGQGGGSSLDNFVNGHTQSPANTGLFLNLAYSRLTKAIKQRNLAPGNDTDSLSLPILFAFGYLMPEIERFSPGSLPAWSQLQQEGAIGTTPGQATNVAGYLGEIISFRTRRQSYNANPEQEELDAEAALDGVEKLVGTCQRDVVYTKAAFVFSFRKKFKRSIELASSIKDEKQAELVKQVIASSMATDHIKKAEFDEANEQIKKVKAYGPRSVLSSRIAAALIQSDKPAASTAIDEAVTFAEKLTDAGQRAGLLFALASIKLKLDPVEARVLLEKAIREFNKQEALDVYRFSIPSRIPIGCGSEPSTTSGELFLPNATLLEAVKLFAEENPDATRNVVEAITDKPLRIRSESLVIKIALSKLKKGVEIKI